MSLDRYFFGDHDVVLDEAGRIAIPRSFRKKLEEGQVVLTRGGNSCISLFTIEGWEARMNELSPNVDPDTAPGRYTRRRNFGSAHFVDIDKQGRVLIPPRLRDFAGLSKDCIVLGLRDYIEIWDQKRYEDDDGNQDEYHRKKEERELEDAGSSSHSGIAGGDNRVPRSGGAQ